MKKIRVSFCVQMRVLSSQGTWGLGTTALAVENCPFVCAAQFKVKETKPTVVVEAKAHGELWA